MTEAWGRVTGILGEEWRQLTHIQPSNRPWDMPLAAAIASGVPLLVGVGFGRMDFGLVSMLGGLVFLSLPDTRMQHRMVLMMAVGFGMISCYALGALTHFFPAALIVTLTLIAIVAS